MIETLLSSAVWAGMGVAAWHHGAYPALCRHMASRPARWTVPAMADTTGKTLPKTAILLPAHNESRWIAAKLMDLLCIAVDRPAWELSILVGCDGCTDDTVSIACDIARSAPDGVIKVVTTPKNQGKTAMLNRLAAMVSDDVEVLVLSDISAGVTTEGLDRLVRHFQDPSVGAVGAGYGLDADAGEDAYWRMQRRIKVGEDRLGGLLGAHGALYAVRRSAAMAVLPLARDTINDDFVLPTAIALNGWDTRYDPAVLATEWEASSNSQDVRRRMRIGAGNLQQVWRLRRGLIPGISRRSIGLALAFASGKAARVAVPFALATSAMASTLLAATTFSPLYAAISTGFAGLGALTAIGTVMQDAAPRPIKLVQYGMRGYAASTIGMIRWAVGKAPAWGQAPAPSKPAIPSEGGYLPTGVRFGKRAMDITGALVGLTLSLPLFPLLALLIKLDSPGPVLFRQLRVGQVRGDRVVLFEMIKFRSMRMDAEKASGPVWATKRDPRITRIGNFMRKTRLDELPQFWNVLVGDMSLVGPRPERPGFYGKLEQAIPYFAHRTEGIRPGITGLAQVEQGYDSCIEDVRSKVMHDHCYAARISNLKSWLWTDLSIAARTLSVMAMGRGR